MLWQEMCGVCGCTLQLHGGPVAPVPASCPYGTGGSVPVAVLTGALGTDDRCGGTILAVGDMVHLTAVCTAALFRRTD